MTGAGRAVHRLRLLGVAVGWLAGCQALDGHSFFSAPHDGGAVPPVQVTDWGAMPPELVESSGLAVSRRRNDLFWSNNDSGDRPRLYAIDSTATLLAAFDVRGAEATDWEALDIGRCPDDEGADSSCLYAADIGDNDRARPEVQVYVVPEPDLSKAEREVAALGAVRLIYPGGADDAEALAVTAEGDLVVTTKGRSPQIRLFRISRAEVAQALGTGEPIRLSEGVPMPIVPDWGVGRAVTGGALSPDGKVLALRTYTEIYFYAWPLGAEAESAAPTCLLGTREPQGEAVAFLPDGRLLLSSESPGPEGHLLVAECPGAGGGG